MRDGSSSIWSLSRPVSVLDEAIYQLQRLFRPEHQVRRLFCTLAFAGRRRRICKSFQHGRGRKPTGGLLLALYRRANSSSRFLVNGSARSARSRARCAKLS